MTTDRRAADAAAWRTAVRLLRYRMRTVAELRGRLETKGHEPSVVRGILARLEDAGLIDDRRFAREWVFQRTANGYGRIRILRELKARGVPEEVAEGALREVAGAEAQNQALRKAADKGRRRICSTAPSEGRMRQRLYAYLLRRGFSRREIREVLDTLPEG